MIITPKKLPSGGQPPETLLAENKDWGPGWNIVDEITESREKTENFSSADGRRRFCYGSRQRT